MSLSPSKLISVIIPAYNAEATLKQSLVALSNSTYPNLEILVVNDGSSDRTAEIASSFPGIRLISQKNAGSAAAKNTGAREAKGDWLYFLDSDVVVFPETVQKMIETAEQFNVDLVVGRYSTQPMNQGLIHHYKALMDYIQYIPPDARNDVRVDHQMGGGGDFISRKAFEQAGGFLESFKGASIEREEFYLRFYKEGFHSAANPEIRTRHYFPDWQPLIKNYWSRIFLTVEMLQNQDHRFSYISFRNGKLTPIMAITVLIALALFVLGLIPAFWVFAAFLAFVSVGWDFFSESLKRKGAIKTVIFVGIHWWICCNIFTAGALSYSLVWIKNLKP